MNYIMCGVPGSGKSTLANKLAASSPMKIVSADHYFYGKNGEYNFVREKLGEAHEQCKSRFLFHQAKGKSSIHADGSVVDAQDVIVDNTNCRIQDLMWYIENSGVGEDITIVYLSGDVADCAARNLHNVPLEVVSRMREQQVETLIELTSCMIGNNIFEYENDIFGRHRVITLNIGRRHVRLLYMAN